LVSEIDYLLLIWPIQVVIIENQMSAPIRVLIGSAQGEVLSGDILNCLTDPIHLDHPNRKLLKFADDKFLVASISDRTEFDQYQEAAHSITAQLSSLELQVNDDKTKELIIDFTDKQRITGSLPDTNVLGNAVKRVSCMKMVGYHLNDALTTSNHVATLCKKANSKLFLLYKMASMRFPRDVLMTFYNGAIRSPLEFAAPAFHYNLTERERKSIEKIQKRALRVIRKDRIQKTDRKSASDIISTDIEPLADRRSVFCDAFFDKLLSQSCYLIPPVKRIRNGVMIQKKWIRTARYQKTFIPSQIDVFNNRNILNPETKRAHSRFTPY
jgi:hypothetical protein